MSRQVTTTQAICNTFRNMDFNTKTILTKRSLIKIMQDRQRVTKMMRPADVVYVKSPKRKMRMATTVG